MRMILFDRLIEKRGDVLSGRAFEITEFLQCNRSVRVATNMNGFRRVPCRGRLIRGDIQAMRLQCLTEQRAASEGGQCDHTNNDESEIAFHTRRKRGEKLQRMRKIVKFFVLLQPFETDPRITQITQMESKN